MIVCNLNKPLFGVFERVLKLENTGINDVV